ncbi:MAG TPA: hypothetical protein VNX00_11330 [Herbaspirillum sp.]|jgi:hypothetical protein|nr:hypothetical protein [Herbaspirillum sp.]
MLKIFFWLLVAINSALFALGQGLLEKQPVQRNEPQRLAQQLHPEQLVLSPTPTVAAPVKPAAPAVTAVAIAQPATPTPTITPAPVPAVALPVLAATTPTPVSTPATAPAPAVKPSPPAPTAAPDAHLLACVEIGNFDPSEAKSFRVRLAAAKLSAQPMQRPVQEVASYMVFIAAEDGRDGANRRGAELHRLGLNDFYILPDSSPRPNAISLGLFKTEAAAKTYVGQLIAKGVRSANIAERTASSNKVAFRLHDLNAADQAGFAALVSAFPNQSRRDCNG